MTVGRFNGLSLQDHHMTISMLEEIEPIFLFVSLSLRILAAADVPSMSYPYFVDV